LTDRRTCWRPGPDLHREIINGPVCFFAEHSIGSKDGRVPRYADSHACVRCISALTEGRLTLDVHRIHQKHRRKFLEFWSFVQMGEPDECWEWQGVTYSSGSPAYRIKRFWSRASQFSASRAAAWFAWGDIGRLPITQVCGNIKCCNPLHIRVKSVPHFYHHRRLQLVDLEFSAAKLMRETCHFLEATRRRNPTAFEKLLRINQDWVAWRLLNESGEGEDVADDDVLPDGDELADSG
jgi:hypothetical protein